MNSKQIREEFLRFFESKSHQIVPSAPMVVKNDPTLMFTNAGMNQFKDLFLGNSPIKSPRIADSQKCLRVSGKHNDLEEVGHDTYHHTMFEMLGNWSFGDYFKKDAIDWAWELLVDIFKIPVDRLYATVFEGSKEEGLEADEEAKQMWLKYLPADRIIYGNKKDNFWEMGDSGPCGPCSEIHVDIRTDDKRALVDGASLVNQSDPHVIEIWNLVFIQYNRKVSGQLELLPAKHVDTGMGFERLAMVVQGKQSNYDTDVFQPIIQKIAEISGKTYGAAVKSDIAMRVIADHVRTIAFAIADGQLPSNNKAGYVIRRILRRGVRYGYSVLGLTEPFLAKVLVALIETMGKAYPELVSQRELIEKVMTEEEVSFLRTLETGIHLLDNEINKTKAAGSSTICGKTAFVLYDTHGFPLDLTELILKEQNMELDKDAFDLEMKAQKDRSRSATSVETDDWVEVSDDDSTEFIGYDYTEATVQISRYRKVKTKQAEYYQLVFNVTPFYAESGGQVGDCGWIESEEGRFEIKDTKKENNLSVHITETLPSNLTANFAAKVDIEKRKLTQSNHSATHLLHQALRQVLGTHVEQKGSLVEPDRLRFDFSHFQKMTDEEIEAVERIANENIRKNHALNERRNFPVAKAQELGAMMLFGEKYGDFVRVIQFGESVELCGGTHVSSTSEIGSVKIISESAIAAGVRRMEAITSTVADNFIKNELDTLSQVRTLVKSKDVVKGIEGLLSENDSLRKQLAAFEKLRLAALKEQLEAKIVSVSGVNVLAEVIELDSAASVKDLVYQLKDKIENLFLVIGTEIDGKASLSVMISENLVKERNLNAGAIIRDIAKLVDGGGGGQAFYATAGGKNPAGLAAAVEKGKAYIA